ncbi:MAG TPA: hypothetical protein VF752_00970 [Thermoleophilaceae bacterium]
MRTLKRLCVAAAALALLALPASALASSKDRNHDRIPDRWEKRHHLSLRVNQAKRDQDNDGLNNLGEFRSHTDPRDPDTDNDGVEDGDEDADRDGVDNENEIRERTNPEARDSNHNGRSDGREDADHDGLNNTGEDRTGNDPVDPDTDDDGVKDGKEVAGTIASFNGTTLVINLAEGGQRTGTVNASTEIKCETEDELNDDESGSGHDSTRLSRDGSDDGPNHDSGDDNSGPGSDAEHDGDEDNRCTTADLTTGTGVHEAELRLDGSFEEIELIK